MTDLLGRIQRLTARQRDALEREKGARLGVPRLEKTAAIAELPLSFAQQRLWFISQLEPDSSGCNIQLSIRLRGALDADALRRAFEEIVQRHDVLRTSFPSVQGRPVHRVHDAVALDFEVREIDGAPVQRLRRARQQVRLEGERPFDVGDGPLIRIRLLRLAVNEHVLLVAMHHIVGDAYSLNVLFRELLVLYRAFSKGEPSPVPELPFQYADFARWQRACLQGDVLERQLEYWRRQLAGLAQVEPPPDRFPTTPGNRSAAQVKVKLPAGLVRQLERMSQQHGATLFMTMIAAWCWLLARYTGARDIAVGTDVANRSRPESEGLIGFFVNQLVLRMAVDPHMTFRELLAQVRATCLEAYQHEDLPFERLVEELAPARDLSHSPLFRTKLTLVNVSWAPATFDALELHLFGDEVTGAAQVNVHLALIQRGDELRGSLVYAAALYTAWTVKRIVSHYRRLLRRCFTTVDAPLAALDFMTATERRSQRSLGQTTETYETGTSLHDLFCRQAMARPDAIAIAAESQQLTYRELERRANGLAWALRRAGVSTDCRVGLCIDRSPELVIGVLAILKAGGAYVPLDPSYPEERLAFIAADAGVQAIVTRDSVGEAVPAIDVPVVRIGDAPATSRAPAAEHIPEQAAYVIYTSGSTGRPKGVVVSHANVARLLRATEQIYDFEPCDVWTLFHSYAFDFSVWEIWGALAYGGRLVVVPYLVTRAPDAFQSLLRREQVTVLNLTPSAFYQWQAHAMPAGPLRYVVFGGESFDPRSLTGWWDRIGTVRPALLNMYGITETTVHVTARRLRPPDTAAGGDPIGRPLRDLSVYVLDRHMTLAPGGVWGELHVGGDGVARGYLDRTVTTAERFVPDPFGRASGKRLYRTGDRGRWRVDGSLEFGGRIDAQFKVRGFRIEPGEIETALRRLTAVQHAAVMLREDTPGDLRVVAYLGTTATPPSADELRATLARELPQHMLPSAFVCLPVLPLTPNGKVDRDALPAPVAEPGQGGTAARTSAEDILLRIWHEVLRRECRDVHANFFESGGHSLLATQVVSRAREVFGVSIPLRTIFEAPTVAGLAAVVEAARRRGETDSLPPLVPAPRANRKPLSFAQQRLWFLEQLEPGTAVYNVPHALRLRGAVSVRGLQWTLSQIARRHEVLRARFPAEGGEPWQEVAAAAPVPLPVLDVSRGGEAEARRVAGMEAAWPFDLARGPVWRARLLRLAPADHVLLVTQHHIVSDGWSVGVLGAEFAELYGAWRERRAVRLPALPIQYADFAVWQRQWLQGEVLEEQLSYWRDKLTGVTALQLPCDFPRPAALSYRGGTHQLVLPQGVTHGIATLARREGATPYMILLAAFQTLLSRYSGQDDIVVGSPIANRTPGETERLIGFFVNTLAMRTDLSGDPSFLTLLRRVKELSLGAYAHQDVPFEKLVDELQPDRDLSRNPLFQVSLAVQNAPIQDLDLGHLAVRPFSTGTGATRFDLELHIWERNGSFTGLFSYSFDLFRADTVERISQHFVALLESAVSRPERRLSELAVLSAAEELQLVAEWNSAAVADRDDQCLHELFEVQATRRPDAVAVVADEAHLTYGALNRRANRVARAVLRYAPVAGAAIGVCVPRCADLVVAQIGILKAGGMYVPLDPEYPSARLRFIIDHADLAAIVTTSALQSRVSSAHRPTLTIDVGLLQSGEPSGVRPRPVPQQPAYVIYTSGSTGVPKGVVVPHRAVGRLLSATSRVFTFTTDDVWSLFHSAAFDFSVWEVWGALAHGARVVIIPYWVSRAPERCAALLAREQVTVLSQTPTAFRQLSPLLAPRALRWVVFGGEALDLSSLAPWFARCGDQQPTLVNMYGITETTVHVTHRVLRREDVDLGSRIGRALPGWQVYLLDRHLRLAPTGVVGEVCVAGAGLAQGYLHDAPLTASRFVPNAFGPPGDRLYRSGDLARYAAAADLLYRGRCDSQVKLRGFRIELGEIEAVLAQHPAVEEAAVLAPADAAGDRRLVAYLMPRIDRGSVGADAERGQVEQWQTLYEDTYRRAPALEDASFDLAGWNSSYTGEPIPAAEMLEWVERTCERILSLKPERVLEIGCGTGLLLFRIARQVEAYCGMDFSHPVLDQVGKEVARRGLTDRVSLLHRTADDLSGVERGSYDAVIINSVAQYFPGAEYFARVLEGAAAALAPGGALFVGDVRDLRLLDAYHASVQVHRASPGTSHAELLGHVRRRAAEEEELLVSPSFFHAFGRAAGFGSVRTLLKRGAASNELTKFRFDAILSKEDTDAASATTIRSDWRRDNLSLASVRDLLARDRPDSMLITGVPVGRLAHDLAALASLNTGNESEGGDSNGAPAPFAGDSAEAFWELEQHLPYSVELGVGAAGPGTCDVLCWRRGTRAPFAALVPAAVPEPHGWASYANNPLHGSLARRIVPAVREHLAAALPSYMVPSTYVVLPAMPLTPNGKVDRRALPEPEATRPDGAAQFVAARTATEERLAEIWSDLLGLTRVSVEDSFFELGGHSLKATQLAARIRDAFGVELTLRQVFESPAVASQARLIERLIEVEIEALSDDDAARQLNEPEAGAA